MKILIVAYHFYPDVTPRSFRAFELVKELGREGHDVKVLLPKSDFNFQEICKKYNFSIDFVDYYKTLQNSLETKNKIKNNSNFININIMKVIKNFYYCIFPSGRATQFYFYAVYKKLIHYNEHFDMIISIATPYDTHMGIALAMLKKKNLFQSGVKVADYGDPLYKNPALPSCFLYYWIDKFISSKFDYVTVPTETAISIFETFKNKKNIKLIPQGFDFSNVKRAEYVKNKTITFAYAGIFYEDIRNPKPLLDFLLSLDRKGIDFRFVIYTKINNINNMNLLNKYQNELKKKLCINASIPREDVIYELSKMDFLINIDNLSESQTPSKLIDYALTKRPIFSFNQLNFSDTKFMNFINAQYSDSTVIDLDKFDIKKISNQFVQLGKKLNDDK